LELHPSFYLSFIALLIINLAVLVWRYRQ
ncbi:hypothetical protein M3643_13485, partial [Staphylococcus lugdunensis]|nr:hypothetical protein [Staphylococcus lugdunensis]